MSYNETGNHPNAVTGQTVARDCMLLLSYRCLVNVNVLWLFIAVQWVGLQCVIVVPPGHTHLLYISRPCQS